MNQLNPKVNIAVKEAKSWVEVQSCARLHMGFFDLHGGLGRQFGSIGLSIDAPKLAIKVTKADAFSLHLPKKSLVAPSQNGGVAEPLIETLARRIHNLMSVLDCPQPVVVEIASLIPTHTGLGSGTQLALSIGMALNTLFDQEFNLSTIAHKTGRGNRSGIGIAAFEQGGLLIDGGRSHNVPNETPPILARYIFPKAWSVLLIEDSAQAGIHGEAELHAFKTLPAFSEDLAAHLCRHVLMQTMPAMMAEDLVTFGASIHALQAHVGDYFAPAQGGRYASRAVGKVLEYLLANDAPCVGQSSWGPTGFAVFENEVIAHQYLTNIKDKFSKIENNSMRFKLCHANNTGAVIISG
jgi:beta-ribofuranosylaminobenzene 5'-phosphate synthase